jgi:hypothetical protein
MWLNLGQLFTVECQYCYNSWKVIWWNLIWQLWYAMFVVFVWGVCGVCNRQSRAWGGQLLASLCRLLDLFPDKTGTYEVLCTWIIWTIVSFTQEFTEHEELLELVGLQRKKTFHCKFIAFFKDVVLIWLNEGTSFPAAVNPVLSASF